MIRTEAYYCWKQPSWITASRGTAGRRGLAVERLITPRSNPSQYENPADLLFSTKQEAIAWRDEELDRYVDEVDEVEYISSWVLCLQTTAVIEEEEK